MALTRAGASRRGAPRRTWLAAAATSAVLLTAAYRRLAFVSAPSGRSGGPPSPERRAPHTEGEERREERRTALRAQSSSPEQRPATDAAAAAAADQGRSLGATARRASSQGGTFTAVDENYNPTWLNIEEQPISSLVWLHPQSAWAGAATALYAFDMVRILLLIPPTAVEAFAVPLIYFGLYGSRYQEIPKLEPHYQVSFIASCGWTFYAWASLVHAMACSPHGNSMLPLSIAEPLHTAACMVYLASCLYFYSYHWGRQARHVLEGRFRPWFALGLASLTAVHSLTVGHIWKMLDDPGWFSTVAHIYPDQWQWIADTRLLELYLTAAALFLVILHLRGVLTGTKNAAIVFLGTVILPTGALFLETYSIDAVAWQHYFMVGPKYFY